MEAEMIQQAGQSYFWTSVALLCMAVMESVWLFYCLSENRRLRSELNALAELNEENLKITNEFRARNDYLSGRVKELDDALQRYSNPRDHVKRPPPSIMGDPGDENRIIDDSIGQYGPGGCGGFGF